MGKWIEIGKFMVCECVPWKCGKFLPVVPKYFAPYVGVEMDIGNLDNGARLYLRLY